MSISSFWCALHTQFGRSREVVCARRIFFKIGLVTNRPLIVTDFQSLGVIVASLNLWLILCTPMRCWKDRYPNICSRISVGMLDSPLLLLRGVLEVLWSSAHFALCLRGYVGGAVLGRRVGP